jgi:hypothetical protein
MATHLEKGIIAARNGNTVEAKRYLVQVLKQDSGNEQAWLWMSEVVDTIGEQIACIEQVLQINPHNQTAQLALKKLKSQPVQRTIAIPYAAPQPALTPAAANILYAADSASIAPSTDAYPAEMRKPFRLSDAPGTPSTVPLDAGPPMPLPPRASGRHLISQHPRSPAINKNLSITNGQTASKKTASKTQPDSMPLVPLILFGTLSVTATGGLFMIVLLIAFG